MLLGLLLPPLADALAIERVTLNPPSYEEVAAAVHTALIGGFEHVDVRVEDSPDLVSEGRLRAARGLHGNTSYFDIGSVSYLTPVPDRDRTYNLTELAEAVGLGPNPHVMGCAAAHSGTVGQNAELILDARLPRGSGDESAKSVGVKIPPGSSRQHLFDYPWDITGMLGNVLLSEGQQEGPVLHIRARRRLVDSNLSDMILRGLERAFGRLVVLSGVFRVDGSPLRLHVMPDFAKEPLETPEEVDKWLRFFEVPPPHVCLTHVVAGMDVSKYELRPGHSHCVSPPEAPIGAEPKKGGHYHNDTDPLNVAYDAYYVLPRVLFRVDRPGFGGGSEASPLAASAANHDPVVHIV